MSISKLYQIYQTIRQNSKSLTDVEQDFNCFQSATNNDLYQIISEDTIKILNEYVQDPQLTPVPKQFLNVICNRIKYRRNNIVVIPMHELSALLKEYEYPYFKQFKDTLNSYTGNLYIVLLFERDFKHDILPFNSTYQFLEEQLNDSNISTQLCEQLLNERLKYVDAFCSKLNNDNINCSNDFYKNNCLIFISLSGDSIKDSLQHELTHFIQKTVGLNKSLSKIQKDPRFNSLFIQDKNTFEKLLNWIKSIPNHNEIFLLNFFKCKFQPSEFDQTIKAVLNGIQRIYEYSKLNYIPQLEYTEKEINKAEHIPDKNKKLIFRQTWLEKFITTIHSNDFQLNQLFPIITNNNTTESQQYLIKYRHYFIIFLYLTIEKIFPNINIQEKLTQHFNKFIFKDN